MCSRDLFGDCGQGRITGAAVLEPILRHGNGVISPVPFADKTRAWLQAETWCRADAARSAQGLGQRLQLAKRCLAEPAMLNLLAPIGNPKG